MNNMTVLELAEKAENEELDYLIMHYIGRDVKCCDDPKLVELWHQAYDALKEIRRKFDEALDNEYGEDDKDGEL